jgi:hypothetical protein
MSYLASLLIIIGYLLVVLKKPIGFPVQMAGCLIFIALYAAVDYGIVLVNTIFFFINLFGIIKWVKNEDN